MNIENFEEGTLETWTPREVNERFSRNDIAIIDVRTPQEYMFEHIEGVLLMPMAFFDPDKLPSQSGKPIVFHCGSGVRSNKVAQRCLEAGLQKVAHMEGGFTAWKQAGLPYIGTDMGTGSPQRMTAKP